MGVGRGRTLRSIDEAPEFAHGLAKQRNCREWDGVLDRLETVRTKEDARDAANALRALLEAEDLLVSSSISPADPASRRELTPRYGAAAPRAKTS